MQVSVYNGKTEELRHIAQNWYAEACNNNFNLEIDIDAHLSDLQRLANADSADLLVLYDRTWPVGYMGIAIFTSPLSRQVIANEHYWYVIPESRGIGSVRLVREGLQWAKNKGCSHFIMNASNLASCLHDKVCNLYEKLGMRKFETSYIVEI